jgi:type I restriction enzyme M protein
MINETSRADHKLVFQEIRNYLAGRAVGATRDQALLEEVMKCLFAHKRMLFRNSILPVFFDDNELAAEYKRILSDAHSRYFQHKDLLLDPASVRFVHDRLSTLDLLTPARDPVGDLYEAFIGSAIRGSEGQFFTPQNAGRWLVQAAELRGGERVIDPACGAGGFLVWAAQAAPASIDLHGIEKDAYLASLAQARLDILGYAARIECANSLSFESDQSVLQSSDYLGSYDVVLTNPPFGKNISSVSRITQEQFDLGRKWGKGRDEELAPLDQLALNVPPQVLFIERVLSLLRTGGRACLVIPESLLSSRRYGHVVHFIRKQAAIRAIVGMPESLFKHSGKGGTHTKTCLLVMEKGKRSDRVFMAEAKWCGHDSRGRTIPKDDLPQLARDFTAFKRQQPMTLGYEVPVPQSTLAILAPRYHEPSVVQAINELGHSHDLISIGDLVADGALQIRTGNEVGKLAYGTGTIPFVRTSDISGWEVKIDPKHCVSEVIYEGLRADQDVRRDDILIVRDGTYLIGSCAIITEYDERIVYQSHIMKLRCVKDDVISPPLLLAALSSAPVQRQIRAKTVTQDIIDSLGNRLQEVLLPLPKNQGARREVERIVRKVIADRVEARELARKAKLLIVDPSFGGATMAKTEY